MLDAKTQRAEEIFCDAQEMTDACERRRFVDRTCAGDPALRAAVEEMLASQSDADRFFRDTNPAVQHSADTLRRLVEESSAGLGLDPVPEEQPGTRIGPYRLLQKLGEGGCGAVYMAEQEQPVRRQVALKIIKLGMDTRSVISRFRAEQQALALMDHPNIAHVLDAGATDTGRPYFVMELVRGVKLTTHCDEEHLDTRARLHLFIQVCHAIQHAHQKGIIHRDIKPSNILVTLHDSVAVPKVIDFGIAKAVEGRLPDQTLFTAYEQFIGTPAYMSPEQAGMSGLDVDTRSDVYSLGVLLYELLTGKTPFDTKALVDSGMEAMRRTLRDRDPQRPSAAVATLGPQALTQTAHYRHSEPDRLISQLRGDLDWIVMKALEKDRSRRYQTANSLASDVQRYLDNEPVLARPPSRLYRFRKLVQRNKIVFAAGSVTAIALLGSSTVSTWLLVKERAARHRAVVAEQQKGSLEKEAGILRRDVESQKRFAQAFVLFKEGKTEKADAILDTLPTPNAAPEFASMYRELGDWHALDQRWAKAKARLDVLTQINHMESTESTMDDARYAALLAGQGYPEEYERFRESLLSRYAGTDNPVIAQRIIRECLLTPASEEVMTALDSFADTLETSITQADSDRATSVWESYAMAMMSYRRGDYDSALKWCQRDNPPNNNFPTRDYSVRLIQAATCQRLGRHDEAQAELEACRAGIEKTFAPDAPKKAGEWKGFWFDRVYLQIHLREATAVIEGEPAKLD
jgi:hypothetical protein